MGNGLFKYLFECVGYIHVQARDGGWVFPSVLTTLVLETGFIIDLGAHHWLDWLASKLQQSSRLHLLIPGYEHRPLCLAL